MTYQTEYDPTIGCNIPTDITFTPALFASLDISEEAVASARRSRVEWENKLRKKQGLDALGMDELIDSESLAFCARAFPQLPGRAQGPRHETCPRSP